MATAPRTLVRKEDTMFQLSKLTPAQATLAATATSLGAVQTSTSGVRFDASPADFLAWLEGAAESMAEAAANADNPAIARSLLATLTALRTKTEALVVQPGATTVTAPVVLREDGSPALNVLSVQYGYFAHDAFGSIIVRDDLTAEQLRIQQSNLVVSGYHVSPGRTDGCDTCGYVPPADVAAVPSAVPAARLYVDASAATATPAAAPAPVPTLPSDHPAVAVTAHGPGEGPVVRERKARHSGNRTVVTHDGPGAWTLQVWTPDGAFAGSRTFPTRAAAVKQARQGVIG